MLCAVLHAVLCLTRDKKTCFLLYTIFKFVLLKLLEPSPILSQVNEKKSL